MRSRILPLISILPYTLTAILSHIEWELPPDWREELIGIGTKSNEVEAWWILANNHRSEMLPRLGLGIAQLLRSAEQIVTEFSSSQGGEHEKVSRLV